MSIKEIVKRVRECDMKTCRKRTDVKTVKVVIFHDDLGTGLRLAATYQGDLCDHHEDMIIKRLDAVFSQGPVATEEVNTTEESKTE